MTKAKHYLIIFEDNEMKVTSQLHSDIIQGHEYGILDIIDISDPSQPMLYDTSNEPEEWTVIVRVY